MSSKIIFPNYSISQNNISTVEKVIIETNVRISRNCKWYLVPIIYEFDFINSNPAEFNNHLSRFIQTVYRTFIMYKINPKKLGNVLIDENQEHEYERLKAEDKFLQKLNP